MKIENNFLIPKKSLGQNFLIDQNIQKKIIKHINIKNEIIIEIGPGKGQMTDQILSLKPKELILIEKDFKLYKIIKKKYIHQKNVTIYNKDALTFDYNIYKNIKIFSNLPYNLSTKIIINLLTKYDNIKEMVFTIQKEVANKLDYNKNKKNKYSFIVECLSKYKKIFNISNKVFYPKPKVQSTVIKITPIKNKYDKEKLLKFSNEIFKNKRKKISNVIKFNINDKHILKFLESRSEDLNKKELLELFKFY